jgi:phosphohistidine phosphatase SixA
MPCPGVNAQSSLFFVFLRHGDKTWASSEGQENPLSTRGQGQAHKLVALVQQEELPPPWALWSSPLLRCRQTLTPLAEYSSLSLEPKPSLLLHQEGESFHQFHQRIRDFLSQLTCLQPRFSPNPAPSPQGPISLEKNKSPTSTPSPSQALYLCSHQDWLYEIMEEIKPRGLLPEKNHWPTGRWMELHYDSTTQIWTLHKDGRLEA